MESGRTFSHRNLLAALALLVGVIIFHPTCVKVLCSTAGLLHLLVRSEETAQPLNYVRDFLLWTRRRSITPEEIKVGSMSSLASTSFYPTKTYVIHEDCNVIAASWDSGTTTLGYYVVQGARPQVGEDIGRLIRFLLHATALTKPQIHLIGHSLGAHAVGISLTPFLPPAGLDPAGLMYHTTDRTQRLDRSDAEFVDVIHTHGCTTILNQWSDCYGIDENLGDADFWPNGGERQPMCKEGGDGHQMVREGSSCDHGIAYVLYTESIQYATSTTRFLARPCHSWKYYNNGSCPCGSTAQYMGFNVNPSNTSPYALLDSDCTPAHFSFLQIIALVLLSVITVLMTFVVVTTVLQQYFRSPILSVRIREAFRIDTTIIQGVSQSSSTQILTESVKDQVIT
ncbi:hypothetical protein C7M84_018686 [Penaeus vannamei]|uniref:Lipase domain-containing protein n=1 Tax=Penaeus vannamei TaxID=6689 RepID=A0A3R7PYE8_PENVA|nr:hypothetical protein C7M84_018686 [Penaeus vannamei]